MFNDYNINFDYVIVFPPGNEFIIRGFCNFNQI